MLINLVFMLQKKTKNSRGTVFEPNDFNKGEIARALLYMAACYNNFSGDEDITDFKS